MTGFLIAAALLLVVALALLVRPWWWRRRSASSSQRALNAAIYRDELAEIERDRISGELAESDYEEARAELQRRLLEDAAGNDMAAAPAQRSRATLISLWLALPLAAAAMYAWLGDPAAITAPPPEPQLTRADVDRMVSTLAEKLEKEPDNLQGWAMLARSYKVLRRPEEAARAFEKAGSFVEQDPNLLADYADLLASQAGGNLAGRPEELVLKALKLDPNHLQSLWLAGTAAFNRKDFGKAVAYWEHAVTQLPPDSEDAQMLTRIIAEAKQKQEAKQSSSAQAITGRVELAASLKDKVTADDTVFVLVRATDGSPMPLAAVRARVVDLPLDFHFDDSDALSPERKLSAAKAVRVEARVSKSGDAQSQSGDLIGQTAVVKPRGQALRVTIDRVVE